MSMAELNVNPKFRDLLDLPSEGERKELERQLLRDGGPRDPIVVWKETKTIVDGHNRYAICKAHNLQFIADYRSFKDEAAVEEWIIENQLARRNLSPARATYFLGLLYNKLKQDPSKAREATEDGKTTAEKLGEQFGVDEKTVRRAADVAKGIETVASVKGLQSVKDKIALLKAKGEGFTKGEMEELGKVSNPVVAQEAAKIMVEEKKEAAKVKTTVAATKAPAKKAKEADPKKQENFSVVFTKPAFDRMGWSVSTEERPPMAENCMVYMFVPDEELTKAIDLLRKWGLNYEASFIFTGDRYEGTWSDITHTMLIAASRGVMTAPKKASQSMNNANGSIEVAMIKLIEGYHPGVKRLDMRKNATADGWAKKAA